MKLMLQYLKPYQTKVVFGIFIKALAGVLDLMLPFLLAMIIDTIIPTQSLVLVVSFGLVMFLAAIASLVLNIWANRISARISTDATLDLRKDGYRRIMQLSASHVDQLGLPSLVSRMTTDTYHIYRFYNVMQRMGIRAPILLFGALALMAIIDFSLSLIVFGLLPILFITIGVITVVGIPHFEQLQKSLDELIKVVRENLTGIRVVKAFNRQTWEIQRFQAINVQTSKREVRANVVVGMLNPTMALLLNAGLVLILWVGTHNVMQGTSQVGTIIAYISYFTMILNAFYALNRIFMLASKATASATRLDELFHKHVALPIITVDHKDYPNSVLAFENVTFGYYDDKPIVKNISFTLHHHETLVIIGATGSGKSTIAQLCLRFYDPQGGSIALHGTNIQSIPLHVLRNAFAVVLQNEALFSFTVAQNIELGENYPQQRVLTSLKLAQADFVYDLPQQLETQVKRAGANFSGGQKQRLILSRAFSKPADVLILDDASSALDYLTEARIFANLKSLPHRCALIITQRVSLALNADKVLMLDAGEIVGYGTHVQLMKTCVPYQNLVHLQLRGSSHD